MSLPDQGPYQQLPRRLRGKLALLLTRLPDWEKPHFMQWYADNRCPAAHGQSFDSQQINGCPSKAAAVPEFFYNILLNLKQRISLACLGKKMWMQFPRFPAEPPGIGPVKYVGGTANVQFYMNGDYRKFRRAIERNPEFTDNNGASHGRLWGMRSVREGAELHIEQANDTDTFSAHIDLLNPGKERGVNSIVHYFHDMRGREGNYTAAAMLMAMPDACGVGAEDLAAAAAEAPPAIQEVLSGFASHRQQCEPGAPALAVSEPVLQSRE